MKLSVTIYVIVLLICGLLLFFVDQAIPVNIITGLITSIIFVAVNLIATNTSYLKFLWIAARFRNKYIRLSISYLFRIKIENKYLLVRGVRFPDQFQPVGGVFKRLPQSKERLEKLEILDDDLIPIDKTSKDDLRIRVKGKHLLSFMRWYNSSENRETSPWREFFEELIATGYLPSQEFPYIFYNHIRRYVPQIRYSDFAQSYELFIAEIYEVVPTRDQEIILQQMSTTNHNNYLWADESRIRRRGAVPRIDLATDISWHSSWIL